MPKKVAAGCLVRAAFDGEPRYLIVHPSGWYNRGKPYSIPKGLVEAGESPEDAALRETREETGLECRIVGSLGEIDYKKSRKTVIAYLAEPLVAAWVSLKQKSMFALTRVHSRYLNQSLPPVGPQHRHRLLPGL